MGGSMAARALAIGDDGAAGSATFADALAIGADWAAKLATLAATEAALTLRELGIKPSYEG